MPGKRLPGHIRHADELILRATIIQMLHNRPPHLPLRRLLWCARLAPDAEHGTHLRTHRSAMAPEQDHGRRAVAGDVGAGGVDHVRQVMRGKNSSISFLPNSRFMNELAVIMPT